MKTLSTLFGLALGLGIGADQTLAATWVVNTGLDSVDVAPGDGVCADANGFCSLRAAVMQANADSAPDTIVLNVPLVTLSIPWPPFSIDDDSSGDLDILGPVTIAGGGATVEWSSGIPAAALDRVFHFFPPDQAFAAQIRDLTVRGGVATPVELVPLMFLSVGGGVLIQDRAGIRVTVQLDNVKVVENTAAQQGGGVWSEGDLGVQDSTISANRVQASGCGGPVFGGGGLYNVGHAHVVRSTLSGNFALYEYADEGGCGGGILNDDGGVLTMVNSTISSNQAFVAGGGLWNRGQASFSFVTNSFNMVVLGLGGGLTSGSGLQMTASIVALNTPQDCESSYSITNGFNLDSDRSCNLASPDDLPGVDPSLGPLQINPPGLTETHALLPASPAFDRVESCVDVLGNVVAEDQLGSARPSPEGANRCDIGAVEGISDLLFRDGFESAAVTGRYQPLNAGGHGNGAATPPNDGE